MATPAAWRKWRAPGSGEIRRPVRRRGALAVVGVVLAMSAPALGQEATDDAAAPGFVVPDDTWFGEQWSLFGWGQTVGSVVETTADVDVRAPEAWSITKGDPDVIVAVLDTGVDYDHPDLTANLWTNPGEVGDGRETNGIDDDNNGYIDDWRGWDFIDDDNDPSDVRGEGQSGELPVAHGTSIASIIAADDDGWGMVGLAPDVTVMGLRATFRDDLSEAMQYAIDHGASVASMSLINRIPAFEVGFDDVHEVMLRHPEVVYVAAAGNAAWDNDSLGAKPCSYDDVPSLICVAATDEHDELATFFAGSSSFGATTVDLAAPGDNQIVAQPPLSWRIDTDFETGALDGWVMPEGGWAVADAPVGEGSVIYIDTAAIAAGGDGSTFGLAAPLDVSELNDCRISGRAFVDTNRVAGLWLEFGLAPPNDDFWALSVGDSGFGTIQGTNGEWEHFDLGIPNLQDELKFRFAARLRSGAEPSGTGLALDDVKVTCQGGSEYTERNSFAYAEGTSYATPLTAAAAALVWSAYPELDALQVKQAILDGVHPLPHLDGVVLTGGRLDAYGALLAADELAGGSGGLISGLSLPFGPQSVPPLRGQIPIEPGPEVSTADSTPSVEPVDPEQAGDPTTEVDPPEQGIASERDVAIADDRRWLESLAALYAALAGVAGGARALRELLASPWAEGTKRALLVAGLVLSVGGLAMGTATVLIPGFNLLGTIGGSGLASLGLGMTGLALAMDTASRVAGSVEANVSVAAIAVGAETGQPTDVLINHYNDARDAASYLESEQRGAVVDLLSAGLNEAGHSAIPESASLMKAWYTATSALTTGTIQATAEEFEQSAASTPAPNSAPRAPLVQQYPEARKFGDFWPVTEPTT